MLHVILEKGLSNGLAGNYDGQNEDQLIKFAVKMYAMPGRLYFLFLTFFTELPALIQPDAPHSTLRKLA